MNAGMTNRYNYVFDNYERFLDLLNSGQGVVMIGAHVGCWEAGAGFFGEYGKKINIAMFDVEHQQIKELLESNSSSKNNYKIIAINQDAISAVLQMKIALNNGEYLCFNGDRYVDKNNARAVEFMNARANFPIDHFGLLQNAEHLWCFTTRCANRLALTGLYSRRLGLRAKIPNKILQISMLSR